MCPKIQDSTAARSTALSAVTCMRAQWQSKSCHMAWQLGVVCTPDRLMKGSCIAYIQQHSVPLQGQVASPI